MPALRDLEREINEAAGTATDLLRNALAAAEREGWHGVVVLGVAADGGGRFMKSAGLNDWEIMGLVRWGTLLTDDQAMEDLSEPPGGL